MKLFLRIFCFSVIYICSQQYVFTQKASFQKIFKRNFHNQALNSVALKDGGFAFIGISDTTNGSSVLLTKLDCEGNIQWTKKFGASSTVGNISPDIVDTKENDIVFTFNVGSYQNYDIIAIRLGYDGTVKWKKMLEAPGNNMGQAITQTKDGGFVIAGSSGAYGTDVGNSWIDVYLVKFDSNGKVLWSKTYGNNKNIDEAFAITEDAKGNLLATGRYIVDGTFYTYILKTDATGNLKFLKGFGATNQASSAYDIIVTKDQQHYLITGFTTINKNSFQDYADVFVIKTDTMGVPEFTKIYYTYVGSDGSDSGSSLVETENGNFGVGVSTLSFSNHTQGFVPNKNAVFIIRSDGSLLEAKLYNQGGSHYTKLHSAYDGGYLLSGFTNLNIPQGFFTPLIIKTDDKFNSGCKEIDVTNEIEVQSDGWTVQNAPYSTKQGDNFVDFSQESSGSYNSTETYCENFPELAVTIFPPINACIGQQVDFSSTSKGSVIKWNWNFGDQTIFQGDSTTSHIYTQAGQYKVTLIASNGCKDVTASVDVTIDEPVITNQSFSLCQGDSVLVNGKYLNSAGNYSDTLVGLKCDSIVNTSISILPLQKFIIDTTVCKGDSLILGNLNIKEAGIYQDTVAGNPCKRIFTYNVISKTCICELEMPNVFTPNGDGRNDLLKPFINCGENISNYSLSIYNRWGKLVYETDDKKAGWDGNFNEIPAPSDVYVFILRYDAVIDGIVSTTNKKGDISLLR